MKKSLLLGMSLTAVMVTVSAHAIELKGTVTAPAVITKPGVLKVGQAPKTKSVVLMNVRLTPDQKKQLFTFNSNPVQMNAQVGMPSKVDLGMNNVPVLDQGQHGTCVTFANTAAVDAVISKGDFVSQLCNLELGSYLADRGYSFSGWDGSWGATVMNQILTYGVISKDDQQTKSCAGVTDYPTDDEYNHGNPMALDDYHQMSQDIISGGLYMDPYLNANQRFQWPKVSLKPDQMLQQVKQLLANQTTDAPARPTFGAILVVNHCSVGACGSYRATDDTWALTDAIKNDPSPDLGGHEMVITGYDDNAVVKDNEGKKHVGLLMLRNSWGTDVGDQGNYYMSYDYFKQFVLEVQNVGFAPQSKTN